MKTMVAYLVAALWALSLAGGAKAWSSSIHGGAAEASTLESAARAIIHEQEFSEDRKHHQLEHWCNVTVIAQTNRRSALLRLLVQSQSVSSAGPGKGGESSDLLLLEQQAATIGTSLEQQRLAAQAVQSMQKQELASSQLNLDDASKDVEALQHVWEELGGAKASGQNPSAQAVAKLLVEAKKTVQEREAKVAWVQAGEHALDTANMSKLESDYRSKKAAILNFQHQFYATQRSLDVLSSALEDESAYLSDLQSICSSEKRVHERLEAHVLPALRGVPKLVAAVPAVQGATAAAGKAPEVVKVTTAPPSAPVAVAVVPKSPVTTPAPQAKPVVVAAPVAVPTAAPAHHLKKTSDRAALVVKKPKHKAQVSTSVAPPPAATTTVEQAAPPVVSTTVEPPAPAKDEQQAEVEDAAPVVAPVTVAPPAHHHKKKAHHKALVAKRQEPKVTPAPTTTPAPPAASEDADLDFPTTTTVAPPVAKMTHPKKAGKKKKKAAGAFIEGVYSSAAGKMPSAYTAWKPDADPSTPSVVPSTTVDAAKPTGPPVQRMKDLFDDSNDNDSDNDMKMLDTGSTEAASAAPRKKIVAKATVSPPSSTTAPPEMGQDSLGSDSEATVPPPPSTTAPAEMGQDSFSSDDEAAPVTAAPRHRHKHTTTAAPAEDLGFSSDEAPTPEPPHQAPVVTKKLRGKKEDTFDDDADFDKEVKMLDTGSAKQPPAVPEKSSDAEVQEDPTPAPPQPMHSSKKKKKLRGKKEDTFLDGVYNAAAGNLPTAYAAWSPDSSTPATAAPSQNMELKALEADFDSDDDAPTPAPKHRHKHHHHHDAPAPTPPPHNVMKGDDGVIYDDDDLPKHHRSSFSGLEGGWQSFMKKNKKKAKAPKLDPDVAIMESLYTKDGGLPSQYTAWTPDSAPAAPKPEALAKPKMFDDGDLAAVAKDFEKDDDSSFLQVASEDEPIDSIAHLISEASSATGIQDSIRKVFTSFLEVTSLDSDKSGVIAAGMVLDKFAQVLHSQPLEQLSKAHLSPAKLGDLFRQLQNVDPLTHAANTGAAAQHGKQAQAEQWCLYFQQHVQTATPMQQAVAKVEDASNQLAKAVSQRAALLEEVNARKQLQRTVEKDVESLTSLSKSEQQEQESSKMHSFQQHLEKKAGGGSAAAAVATAAEGTHAAREELQDLLEESLQKRTAVQKAQQQKLADLQVALKNADAEVTKKKAEASSAQAGIETARSKLSSIQASCNAALSTMEHRRHAGHMEAHAIEVALEVLGSL